jgi:hypothetical protein
LFAHLLQLELQAAPFASKIDAHNTVVILTSGIGSRPPAGPLEERVCTSERPTAKIRDVRERGRPGRPLGSASAPAGALPWRARGAAPLHVLFQVKRCEAPSPHRRCGVEDIARIAVRSGAERRWRRSINLPSADQNRMSVCRRRPTSDLVRASAYKLARWGSRGLP